MNKRLRGEGRAGCLLEKPIIECAAVFSPGQQYKIRTTCSQFPEAQRPNCRMDTQVDLSGAKKASRRALPAGMTVEAAVVLPVFLFAVANLLSLFLVFWSYSSKEAQLHQTARQIALYAYGQEDGEPDVRLMRLTPVSAPFGIAAFRSSYVVNGCVMHKWIGYSGDGTGEDWERQEEELVYITKSGEAYHRERSCLYLNPSIRLADREEITADYTPCSVCVGGGPLGNRLIYVTDGGSRYHNTVSCSGLRRTIESVTLMQALEMGRHACPRCG